MQIHMEYGRQIEESKNLIQVHMTAVDTIAARRAHAQNGNNSSKFTAYSTVQDGLFKPPTRV